MYRLQLERAAKRQLVDLPGNVRQRAARLVKSLADNPWPPGAQELRDLPGVYRYSLNGWRIIYEIDDEAEQVIVLAVKYKRGPETYKDLEGKTS